MQLSYTRSQPRASWVSERVFPLLPWLFLALASGLSLAMPAQALASWPVQEAQAVLLGYHESYAASGRSITHSGADIAASAGCCVYAPIGGTVAFAGAVPASDGESAPTMIALAILLDDGRTLSLMPLEDVYAPEGSRLSEGDAIGTLAASGDCSTQGPHLHVGLRLGRAYEDPLALLGFSPSPELDANAAATEAEAALAASASHTDGAAPQAAAEETACAQDADEAAPVQQVEEATPVQQTDEATPVLQAEETGPVLQANEAAPVQQALVTSGGTSLGGTPSQAVLSPAQNAPQSLANLDAAGYLAAAAAAFAIAMAAKAGFGKVRAVLQRRRQHRAHHVETPVKGAEMEGRGTSADSELVMAGSR